MRTLRTVRAMEGLIRAIRESGLKFLGDDSSCSMENGLKRDRTARRGPWQAVMVGAGSSWRDVGGG